MNAREGEAPWTAVRTVLLDLVRDREFPISRRRIGRAHHVLIIGTCLGIPYAELAGSSPAEREMAVVVSGHCEERAAVSDRAPRLAGTVEKNRLPDGWADCIVGHCVLDEFHAPLAAFAELARTAAEGASICVSGPVSADSSPRNLGRVAGGETTFWPVQRLSDDVGQSGFAGVAVSDLTGELLPRLRQANVLNWWPSGARWIVLEGRRVRPDVSGR